MLLNGGDLSEYSIPNILYDRLWNWIVGVNYSCITDIVAT